MHLALITTDNREDRRDFSPERPWFGTAVQALLDGFAGLQGELEVHVISCTRAHLTTPLQLAPNITFHSVHVPGWAWLKTAYLGNILAVRRLLRELQPDLVHGQGTERDCALCAVFSGFPNLITIHGNMRRLARLAGARPWSFAGLTAILESLAIRLTGGVVCISSHTRDAVAGLATRTFLIPNAVSEEFFDPRPPQAPAQPVILLVGDILPLKNQLAFLQAIAPLHREFQFSVKLLGKCDPTLEYAAQLIEFAGHHPWCKLAGFVSRADLRAEMHHATVLALPSLEENLPMVILEAMATGLPVAASKVGGIADLIRHGETGMLFEPQSPQSIRNSVLDLLAHPAERLRLASNARLDALNRFQPTIIGRSHLDAYRNLI